MLAIEIDGYTHLLEDVQNKDEKKDKRLNELGINVMRFNDDMIFHDNDNVLRKIELYITNFEMTHSD